MKFELNNALNGLVLKCIGDEGVEDITTYQQSDVEEQEAERFKDFLVDILEYFGPTTSRYSKHRIHISIEPGDKYEDPP